MQVVGLFTLADSRMEQIEKAIRYGKHIISEKPVADTMENEWKVVEMTENTNLISTVNLYLRNSWYHNLMKEYIQQGGNRRAGYYSYLSHDSRLGTR